MRILYVLKGSPEALPPVLSQIKNMIELGHQVLLLVNKISPDFENFITSNGSEVNIKLLKRDIKILNWLKFRRFVKQYYNRKNYEIIILGSLDTAMACYGIYDTKNSVLNIWELYDKNPIYKLFMRLKLRKHESIVCPEYNRAHMLKLHYKLISLPIILPNKPEFLGSFSSTLSYELNKQLNLLGNSKIILYQGQIYSDRQLEVVANALSTINSTEYVFVLIGTDHDNTISRVKSIYNNTLYLGYITAPAHLEVTKKAFIGIVNYTENSLNNLYCAPNKIYEYGVFSVPMIGNNIPGLKYTIEANDCGICVDYNDTRGFIDALKKIEINYDFYSHNALKFYEKVNNKKTLGELLSRFGI